MTDTDISGSATVFPQDDGTGVPDGSEKYDSAAYLSYLSMYKGTQSYVGEDETGSAGLQFTVDTGSNAVDVGIGHAFILSGGHTIQSGSQTAYNRTAPDDVPYVVVIDSSVTGLALGTDTDNDVWLAVDEASTDGAYIRHGNGLSAPADPSVKLGTANTSSGAVTRANDLADADFRNLQFTNALEDGNGNTVTNLSTIGGGGKSQTTVTSDHSASGSQSVWVDASSSPVTVTLPSPSQSVSVRVVAIDATNTVTVSPNGGENISGVSGNRTLSEGVSEEYESDGTNWWVV